MLKKFEKTVIKFNAWFLVAVILISGILASRTLFKHDYYFNMHDDLQMMRQLQRKMLHRQTNPMSLGTRYGLWVRTAPFNYYPQLPYLFGEVFRILSFNLTIQPS
jgi:hypothetical protein